jgi:aminoglycoside/choline kinase family phosphotransferase
VPELPTAVVQYLERRELVDARALPLTPDASDRRYFRIIADDLAPFVLALHATPFEAGSLPFVNVCRLFMGLRVPVPRILEEVPDLGILALEDLGDVTLQAYLGAVPDEARDALYDEATDLIQQIQVQGRAHASPAYVPYTLSFDVDKLTWEMEFFIKHFLGAYRGVPADTPAVEEVRGELRAIVAELAAEPQVLCHRDYHSRNLMVHGGRLFVIDFQDARLGPNTYDLVSLLRDSYVDLPERLVTSITDRFAMSVGESVPEFRRRFDVMALQRNLKALGTFGFQAVSKANPVYAQYVPRTLRYVRENLARHSRFARLHEPLASMMPELTEVPSRVNQTETSRL